MLRPRWSRPAFIGVLHETTGVDPRRYVSFDSPVLLEEVVVPAPSLILGAAGFVLHADIPETVARRTLPAQWHRTGQPLCLSRSRLRRATRIVQRERELVEQLRAGGFAIAHPELLDVRQQIELIHRHETVIGVGGSAMHSRLFLLRPDTQVVYLTGSGGIGVTHLVIQGMKPSGCVFVGAANVDVVARDRQGKPTAALDVEFIADAFGDLGLLGS